MKKSAYDRVAERMSKAVIEQLEKGIVPWHQPWQQMAGAINGQSGKVYRGLNQLMLAFSRSPSRTFLTVKQGNALGGSLTKGSKGTPIMYWSMRGEQRDEKGTVTERGKPMVRNSFVFPIESFYGIPLDKIAQRPEVQLTMFEPDELAEQVLARIKPRPNVRLAGAAAYSRTADELLMPDFFMFESTEAYYSTYFHELGHWTGHPSRLDRVFGRKFGDAAYAREELVAELTATFMCTECHITRPGCGQEIQSAAYLAGWIKKLKGDPHLLLEASRKAQKAADFLLGREAPDTELVPSDEQILLVA